MSDGSCHSETALFVDVRPRKAGITAAGRIFMTTTASTSSAMSLSFHPSELAERVNCIAHWPEGRFTLTELVESFRCFG